MKQFILVACLLLSSSCASQAPPNLTPGSEVRLWQANETAVALGTLQHVVIELNKVIVCPELPAIAPPCHPLVSDDNTRIVIDAVADGLTTLRRVPDGWRETGLAAIVRVENRLDAAGMGRIRVYVTAARAAITSITATP